MFAPPRHPAARGHGAHMPTPHRTRSQGPGSSTYKLPPRLNPRATSVAPSNVPVAQSIVLAQEQLAHLLVVDDESEASSRVFTQPILSPSPLRSIAEPSPIQPFVSRLASTPQPLSSPLHDPSGPIEEAFYQYNTHPSPVIFFLLSNSRIPPDMNTRPHPLAH